MQILKISEEYLIYLTDVGFTLNIIEPIFRFTNNPSYLIEIFKGIK
jgi:hypothetical protein